MILCTCSRTSIGEFRWSCFAHVTERFRSSPLSATRPRLFCFRPWGGHPFLTAICSIWDGNHQDTGRGRRGHADSGCFLFNVCRLTKELRAKGRRKKNTTWVMFIFDFFFEPQMFQKDALSSHGPDVFRMINLSILTYSFTSIPDNLLRILLTLDLQPRETMSISILIRNA